MDLRVATHILIVQPCPIQFSAIAVADYIDLLCFFWLMFRFMLITLILVYYDKTYKCKDESLLKIYLLVLSALHFIMLVIEIVIVLISSRGTIAYPKPRRFLPLALYAQILFFVLEFSWDVVGVVWAYDKSIDCDQSHQVLIFTRTVLVWNLMISGSVGIYLVIRIGKELVMHSCFIIVNP